MLAHVLSSGCSHTRCIACVHVTNSPDQNAQSTPSHDREATHALHTRASRGPKGSNAYALQPMGRPAMGCALMAKGVAHTRQYASRHAPKNGYAEQTAGAFPFVPFPFLRWQRWRTPHTTMCQRDVECIMTTHHHSSLTHRAHYHWHKHSQHSTITSLFLIHPCLFSASVVVMSHFTSRCHNVVCGACRVLVDRYDSQYGTCSNYCAAVGRECVWAAEEEGDSCAVQYESSCTLPIGNGTTSDALCECGTHSSDVTFVALPSCTHACTTQPTTCAELL